MVPFQAIQDHIDRIIGNDSRDHGGVVAPAADPDGPAVALGHTHEWFADDHPPLAVLIGLVWGAIQIREGLVLWIGPACRPCPHALIRRDPARPGWGDRRLLDRSVFVHPRDRSERVWAIDLGLRCAGVAAVVADGAGLSMAESRRLHLAAGAGGGLGLLARPSRERLELSAARTRWLVSPSAEGGQAWRLDLLRAKSGRGIGRRWVVRRSHETGVIGEWTPGDVGLAADVVDRPVAAARSRTA